MNLGKSWEEGEQMENGVPFTHSISLRVPCCYHHPGERCENEWLLKLAEFLCPSSLWELTHQFPQNTLELKQKCLDPQIYSPLGYKWLDYGARHADTLVMWLCKGRKSVEPAGIGAWGHPFDVFLEQAMLYLPASGPPHM